MTVVLLRQVLCAVGPTIAVALIPTMLASSRPLAQAPRPDGFEAFERCRTIADDAARLRCFESAVAGRAQLPPAPGSGATALGPWRLVRTPHPQGGREAVSIMRTAELMRSDVNLAGVMLRCAESGVELLLVLVAPLPPQARPEVTIASAGRESKFAGAVLPPGAAILLPTSATDLATGPWQAAGEIAIEITDSQKPIHGVVSLAGLRTALQVLLANCPLR